MTAPVPAAGHGGSSSPALSATETLTVLAEVHTLLAAEAHLLDDRAYQEWLQLFTPDCLYWMPVDPLSRDGSMRLNVFYDDRLRMEDRVTRLLSGAAFTEDPPTLTARTISAVHVGPGSAEARPSLAVRSNFLLIAYRRGEQRCLGGRYMHRLIRRDGVLRILEKRVELLGSDSPQRPMTFLF